MGQVFGRAFSSHLQRPLASRLTPVQPVASGEFPILVTKEINQVFVRNFSGQHSMAYEPLVICVPIFEVHHEKSFAAFAHPDAKAILFRCPAPETKLKISPDLHELDCQEHLVYGGHIGAEMKQILELIQKVEGQTYLSSERHHQNEASQRGRKRRKAGHVHVPADRQGGGVYPEHCDHGPMVHKIAKVLRKEQPVFGRIVELDMLNVRILTADEV